MLDLRLFREHPEVVKAGLEKIGEDTDYVGRVRDMDERVRALKTDAETRKAELNVVNKAMGKASPEERETKRAELCVRGHLVILVYQKGLEVADEVLAALNITYYTICPQWNDTIRPRAEAVAS